MKKILMMAVLMMLSGYALAASTTTTTTTLPWKSVNTQAVISESCTVKPYVKYKFELSNEGPTPYDGITHVYPVPGDDKTVKIYMVACDSNGYEAIGKVMAKVVWPDKVTYEDQLLGSYISNYKPIIQKAVDQGLLSIANQSDIITQIDTNAQCRLYEVDYVMDNCFPAGMYNVTATACSDYCGCGCSPIENDFEYYSIVAVDLDFSAVDYGPITVLSEKKVAGDVDLTTSAMPTVQNLGNDKMDITISATNMTGSCGGMTTVIPASAQSASPDTAGKKALSATGTAFHTCLSCEKPIKIDFFVTPPLNTCSAAYSGTVTVTGVDATQTCITT